MRLGQSWEHRDIPVRLPLSKLPAGTLTPPLVSLGGSEEAGTKPSGSQAYTSVITLCGEVGHIPVLAPLGTGPTWHPPPERSQWWVPAPLPVFVVGTTHQVQEAFLILVQPHLPVHQLPLLTAGLVGASDQPGPVSAQPDLPCLAGRVRWRSPPAGPEEAVV